MNVYSICIRKNIPEPCSATSVAEKNESKPIFEEIASLHEGWRFQSHPPKLAHDANKNI